MLDGGAGTSEESAHRAAVDLVAGGRAARSLAGIRDEAHDGRPAPASVVAALDGTGRSLDGSVRSSLEQGTGADLSAVRVHTGTAAARSAADVDAHAYAVGSHVVLGDGLSARTRGGQYLLAHEIAHVIEGGDDGVVRRYRKASSFAFGERDTATLREQEFDPTADRQTKPWISLVTVEFTATTTDADGLKYPTGTATVQYFANPVALSSFTFPVSGGARGMSTDEGTFTVHRIEGYGYNSGSASGTPGVDFQWSEREGPNKRYTKKDSSGERAANMSFAVFYNKGEALHAGPLDAASHGCVHVDWNDENLIKRLNYHAVIGLTKVKVRDARKP